MLSTRVIRDMASNEEDFLFQKKVIREKSRKLNKEWIKIWKKNT
jgi:hypothetical protein